MPSNIHVRVVRAIDLFGTPPFQQNAWIQEIAADVGEVYVTQDPEYPGHFGAYFGYVRDPDRQQYPNKAIRDLRILHDLAHLRYWKKYPFPLDGSFVDWTKHIIDAEIYASLVSECYVYFHIHSLRLVSFRHEIWVDRFLLDSRQRPNELTPMLEYRIAAERLRAMTTPNPMDLIEIAISQYLKQNRDWCVIWGRPVNGTAGGPPAFRVVEEHMSRMRNENMTLPEHEAWLNQWSEDKETGQGLAECPFPVQARAFRPIYEQTGRESGYSLLKV